MQAWSTKSLKSDGVLVRKPRGVTKIRSGTVLLEEAYSAKGEKSASVTEYGNPRFRQHSTPKPVKIGGRIDAAELSTYHAIMTLFYQAPVSEPHFWNKASTVPKTKCVNGAVG